MAQIRADNRENYVILLDLLAKANDSVEGLSISDITERERLLDAHRLANKFIGHALTVLCLLDETSVQVLPSHQPFKPIYVVSASIDVLTRSTMEAFLIFHYVFYAPTTREEKNYRYWSYKAAGLAERQNFPTITEEGRKKLDKEKIELDALQNKLKSNAIFQTLTDKQKGQIFEGKGRWKWKPDGKGKVSWREIAIHAGFSNMLASHMYSHLSGYAHSSHTSVLQVSQALENKDVDMLVKTSMDTINILMANMIHEYCVLFPDAKVVLEQSGASEFVDMWISIGCRLGENLDTGQEK